MKKGLFSEIPRLEKDGITLSRLLPEHAESLRELIGNPRVYRYLPTFLFEKKYGNPSEVIRRLYGECLRESMILGVFREGKFAGIAEFYGYREPIHKVSVGYRLLERCWGQGIAGKALGMMIRYLEEETDVEIVTAGAMIENRASARVLEKNGFTLVAHAVDEDWGYETPTVADKWIR